MRMGEKSFTEFSESVDTLLDPPLSVFLEKIRLGTAFNTLYHTGLSNTAGHTSSSSQAFPTDHGYYIYYNSRFSNF